MRENIEIVRLAFTGARLEYRGKHYTLPRPGGEGKPIRTAAPPGDPPPVYIASLGPRSLHMTGALADGWLGTSFVPETAAVFFSEIRAGAESAGRSLADIDLQAGGAVAFTDDPEPVLKEHARGLAFTLGAMGSARRNFYNDAFCRQGWADAAKEVQRLWIDGRRDDARDRMPLELANKVNLIGDDEAIKARLRVHRDPGVTTIRAGVQGATVGERIGNLERFMALVETVNGEGS